MRVSKGLPKHTAQPIGAIKKKAKSDPIKMGASKVAGVARIVPPVHAFQKHAPSRKLSEIITKIFSRTVQPTMAKKNRR